MVDLPIDKHLARIRHAVDNHLCVIIEAPPGTGKTTRVAPALLSGDPRHQTLLIQPRRIAARAAAARIASELRVDVGGKVGYQVRFDRRRSASTELMCMTPGILLRQIQNDVLLECTKHIILDEFHERSVEYDLLLGMLRRVQLELRPDLRIIVMSATLDSESLREYLNQPPVIQVDAQSYPVEVIHTPFRASPGATSRGSLPRRIAESTAKQTLEATQRNQGDCLVFLPGVGEIQQVADALESPAAKNNWLLLKLYGDMRPEDQDRALLPASQRKVILATNVAETSLTIDGVRIVVDSGYARVQRFDPGAGLDALSLEPISMASATQRTGRAGRTAPGACYRLWDKVTEGGRASHLEPEINRVDLVGPVLQLLCWGEKEVAAFPWLTPPRPDAVTQAIELLEWLGAVRAGNPTELGRSMLQLPVHPRLARLLITGHQMEIPAAAAMAAAILSERDIIQRGEDRGTSGKTPHTKAQLSWGCDVTQRVIALTRFAQHGVTQTELGRLNVGAARHALRVAEQFQRLLREELGPVDEAQLNDELQWALLSAFPDRLCKRRNPSQPRGVMVGGRGVKLDPASGVTRADLFLGIQADGRGSEALVRLASAVDEAWLPGNLLKEEVHRFYNPTLGAVVSRERTCWRDLVIQELPIATPTDDETAVLLAVEVAKQFPKMLPPKDKELQAWLDRIAWLNNQMPELQLPSLAQCDLPRLLEPYCLGLKSIAEAKKLPWKSILMGMLDLHQRRHLDEQAPERYQLPSGRAVILQYELGKPPILAARIQEFFGLRGTPRLAGGRVPLLLHLLAPNGRCQQITDDLESFWKNTYPTVRKELRGRYPKHAWPENPFSEA